MADFQLHNAHGQQWVKSPLLYQWLFPNEMIWNLLLIKTHSCLIAVFLKICILSFSSESSFISTDLVSSCCSPHALQLPTRHKSIGNWVPPLLELLLGFFFGQSNYFSTTVNKHNFGIYYPSQLLFSLTAVLSDGQFVHCSPAESFPSCSSMVQFSHEKEKQTKKKPKPKPDSRIHCCDVGRFQQN